MTVRISATDGVEDGITGDDAIEIGAAFKAAAAAIDVSIGPVTPEETPAFGRSYQAPCAERSATSWTSPRSRSASSPPTTT
jgi:anthraniloyl-CoA monooxygenase